MEETLTTFPVSPSAPLQSTELRVGEHNLHLRHVLLFHRHGDRSPILTNIGEKWKMTSDELEFWTTRLPTTEQLSKLNHITRVTGEDPSTLPASIPKQRSMVPLAQLSAQGVDHMVAKGNALRAKYETFLTNAGLVNALNGNAQHHDQVFVISSNIDRTIQSVQCLLLGMFYSPDWIPPEDDAINDKHPVYHVRTMKRNIIAPSHSIDIFNDIEAIIHEDILKRDSDDRLAMESMGIHLRQLLGIPSTQAVPWTAIRDGLTCRLAHGLLFPEGITLEMYKTMAQYDAWLWHTLFQRYQFCHSAYKEGVELVLNHLRAIVQNTTNAKLSFFSAHDNSIVALICALQLQVEQVLPQYGTVITFEVYESTESEWFIRVLFENESIVFADHAEEPMTPFSTFEAIAERFLTRAA